MMLRYIVMFALGLFAWTLIEYGIHGVLSHIFTTFATPLHDEHHRDPHAVFTVGAWLPMVLISAIIFGIFGITITTTIWLGIVAGFLAYEFLHYRMHFARPLCAIEDRMRTRHLAHHFRDPAQIFGVTNGIWDRAFGSEPDDASLEAMRASVAATEPLLGRSNFRLIIRPWFFLAR
jgi:dihydroceramide fatty acyl 2-hydroxylase